MASRYSPKDSQTKVHALTQHGGRNVLDALHDLDEFVLATTAHRCETNPAVAHHDGGDAVPAARREQFVPAHLTVVVGVNIDEARRQKVAFGIDFAVGAGRSARFIGAEHRAYARAIDGHSAIERRSAGAVDDARIADDQIVHVSPLAGCGPDSYSIAERAASIAERAA